MQLEHTDDLAEGPLGVLAAFRAEKLIAARDAESGLRAVIAIHTVVDGRAGGGIRMRPYTSEIAAIRDATRLAATMTLKYAAVGIPLGGAKAVILGDPAGDKTDAALRAFGRLVQRQGGEYWAAEDVGTNSDDMLLVAEETNYMVSLPASAGGPANLVASTAAGVMHAIRACAQWRWGDESLDGRRVTVQGLGQVGMRLARLLAGAGAEVIVADIDPERVDEAVRELGVQVAAAEEIVTLPADVFVPCALGDVINEGNVEDVEATIVAGAANNVFSSAAVADRLQARGRVYAVDYIANAGALVYSDQMIQRPRPARFDDARAARHLSGIFDRILRVLELAEERQLTYREAALSLVSPAIADRVGAEG
jgi:leucine dehydrogenase